jgi:hypothetical protein
LTRTVTDVTKSITHTLAPAPVTKTVKKTVTKVTQPITKKLPVRKLGL